jgi:hypothetical protein
MKKRKRKRREKEEEKEKEEDEDRSPRLNRFSNSTSRFPCYYNANPNDYSVKKI